MQTPLKSKDHRRRLALSSAYRSKVLSTAPNNLIQYLPHWDPVGETALVDQSLEGNDAVADTVTFGVEGIGDGHKSGSFDGTNSFNNVHSAALNTDFDGDEGTIVMWGKVSAGAVWEDSTSRFMIQLRAALTNRVFIDKSTINGQLNVTQRAGGTQKTISKTGITTDGYFFVALTWSLAADQVKMFYEDVLNAFAQVGSTQTGLGTFTGALVSTVTVVGASSTTPGTVWDGSIAHYALWNTPLTQNQIQNLSIIN